MPLIFDHITDQYQLSIWRIDESLQMLEEESKPHLEIDDVYYSFSNETRKKEWLAVRLLTKKMLGVWPQIGHTTSGRPFLQNKDLNISISHTKSMAGILLGKSMQLGLDIENINRNTENILARFLSPDELIAIRTQDNAVKILYWCAKETVFKAMNQQNIPFATSILIKGFTEIKPIGTLDTSFTAHGKEVELTLYHTEIEDHKIVWTI
jgi:phosphopantetheinyl transferase